MSPAAVEAMERSCRERSVELFEIATAALDQPGDLKGGPIQEDRIDDKGSSRWSRPCRYGMLEKQDLAARRTGGQWGKPE
ncbi:hypothetical protein [Phreatobacter sp. AB_2022a]|uniref:hypothetical protein n=1 Tax=Phreatobacter sp. AB_2022a TaxID=3003134 RepID=UPI0022873171|nr:hypothetical protein [Phreatobacter sp. AB_2022a]MCZ0736228.1 hypothetical protein [Phreatobacter sp. AB_2022a]